MRSVPPSSAAITLFAYLTGVNGTPVSRRAAPYSTTIYPLHIENHKQHALLTYVNSTELNLTKNALGIQDREGSGQTRVVDSDQLCFCIIIRCCWGSPSPLSIALTYYYILKHARPYNMPDHIQMGEEGTFTTR